MNSNCRATSGFTLIELMMATTLLVLGVMGFVGAIFTSQMMVRSTKETKVAKTAIVSAVEEFRRMCSQDFDQAMRQFAGSTLYRRYTYTSSSGTVNYDYAYRTATGNSNPTAPDSVGDISSELANAVPVVTTNESWTLTTETYTDQEGTTYERQTYEYTNGITSVLTSKRDAEYNYASNTITTYSNGATYESDYYYDASDRISYYTSTGSDGSTTTRTTSTDSISMITDSGNTSYHQRSGGILDYGMVASIGQNAKVTVEVIVDETEVDPPIDLNGDGDALDTDVAPEDLEAAVLRILVTWDGVIGARELEYTTILARGEMR